MEFPGQRRWDASSSRSKRQQREVEQAVHTDAGLVVPRLGQNFRRARHHGLFEAIRQLDVGLDEAARRRLADWVSQQYATEYGRIPLGMVATCYLGSPYVDHQLDLSHSIVEHYGMSDTMPAPFANARMLVRTGAYEYVEVFADGTLVPIRSDGSADVS